MARLELIVDPDKAKRGFREADQASDKYRRGAKQATDQTGKVQGAFRKLSSAAFSLKGAIAGLGIGVAVTQMSRMATQSIAATAAISEQADVAGIGAERFQELTKAFSDLGGVQEGVTSGALRRFNRRFGLAQEGMGAANKTLERLNINLDQGTGPALEEAITKLGNMENGANRTAEASQLFGEDAGPRLAAVLAQGNEAIDAQIEKLHEQGRVLDEEAVQGARNANDRLSELSDTLSTEFNQRIADNAEEIANLAEKLFNVAEAGIQAADSVAGLFPDDAAGRQDSEVEKVRRELDRLLGEAEAIDGRGGDPSILVNRINEVRRELQALGVDVPPALELIRDATSDATEEQEAHSEILKEVNAQLDFLEGFSETASGSLTDLQKAFGGSAEEAKALNEEAGKLIGLQSEWDAILARNLERRAASDVTSMDGAFGDLGEDEETDAMRNASSMMAKLDRQMEDMEQGSRDLGLAFSSAFEDAVVEGENLRSVLKGLLDDITRILIRRNATEPLSDAVSDINWGALLSGTSGGSTAAGTGSSPAMATSADGNVFTSPSVTSISERGHAEAVLPLERQGGKLGVRASGGGGDTYNIDARGADQAAIARLERRLSAINATIERRAVSAVGSQRQRSFRG